MKKMTTSKPNGSRVQRARRHLAETRKAAFNRLAEGRAEAVDALVAHARKRAFRVSIPTGTRTARSVGDRVREWALGKLAKVVAAKISRDTERRMFRELEADVMPLQRWLSIMNDFAGTPA